jgi:PAS domain S-box-containing protein
MNDLSVPRGDRGPIWIALIYMGIGTVWVTLASFIAHRLTITADALLTFETSMGSGFVLISGFVLYLLLRRRAAALRRSEAASREREAFLEHVTSAGPVVIFRLEPRDGRPLVTWVSDSVERIFGYTPAETLAPGWWLDHVHPDDRLEALRRSAEVATGPDAFEYRLRTRRGDYRWIRDVLRVIDQDGTPEVLGVWVDVTDQRRAQDALEQREAFYRSLIENASDSILVLDASGVATYASASVERAGEPAA